MKDPNKKIELSTKLQVNVEAKVVESIKAMSAHTKISEDEIVNTALRRYIATHSDFFPPRTKRESA